MGKITYRITRKLAPWGGFAVARQLTRGYPRILMYHRFSKEPASGRVSQNAFRQQLILLKRRYNVVTLDRLVDCVRAGASPPPRSVVITVDDGYRDFYTHAYPLLAELALPATLFVTTGFVDRALWLWPDEMRWLLDSASHMHQPMPTDEGEIQAGPLSPKERSTIWRQLTRHLMPLTPKERSEILSKLAESLAVERPHHIAEAYEPVTWDELREMQSRQISVGGHTVHHATLSSRNRDIFPEEIDGCRAALDRELGSHPRHFCYPNGQPADASVVAQDAVRDAGFQSACMAFYDRHGGKNLYALRRHGIGESHYGFLKSVNGVQRLGSVLLGRHSEFSW